MTENRFGRWSVLRTFVGPVGRKGVTCTYAEVSCDCGTKKITRMSGLRNGDSKSCGCLRTERIKSLGFASSTHGAAKGGTKTKTYIVWKGMRARCLQPEQPAYPRYGGRGIAICDRWNSFENFLADMGERPLGMSLDRIDNNGPYSPENCRWATPKSQARNTRRNRVFLWGGGTKLLIEIAEETGLSYKYLHKAVTYRGKTIEQAVFDGFIPHGG